ncbi:MAG: thiol:disulfide interchange protein, partial [Pseudomonadota bacterium]
MKRWMAALPLAALLVIGAVTALQLYNPEKVTFDTADSGTIIRSAPEQSFPTLSSDTEIRFSPPPDGRPIVVNLFASWCAPCRVEHPLLMALS